MLVQNEIPLIQTCEALIQAKQAKLITIFNPSPIPSKEQVDTLIPWESIDWLLVNEDETVELAKAFGHPAGSDALEQLGNSLPRATGIVMTKGSAGVEMLLAASEGGFIRLESPCGQALQPIINTTGAGDTFAVRCDSLRI
jgi:ribokinase